MVRRLERVGVATLVGCLLVLGTCGDEEGQGDQALFCQRLDRLTSNDPFRALGESASSAEVEVAFGALLERADGLVEVAPSEARAAARDFAAAAHELESLLAGAAYLPTQVDARAYTAQQVVYTEAARRLERYLDAEC